MDQKKSNVKDLSFNQISQGTKISICVEHSCLGHSVLFDTLDSDSTKDKKQNKNDYTEKCFAVCSSNVVALVLTKKLIKKCIDKHCLEGLRSLHRERFNFQSARLIELSTKASEAKLRKYNNRYNSDGIQSGSNMSTNTSNSKNVKQFIHDISSTSSDIRMKTYENQRTKKMQKSGLSGMVGDVTHQPLKLGRVINDEPGNIVHLSKKKVMWETPFGNANNRQNKTQRMNKRNTLRKKKRSGHKKKSTTLLPPLIKNNVVRKQEQNEKSPVKHLVAETPEEAQKRFENIFKNLVSS